MLASLGVEVQPVPEASDLAHLVDGYLSQSGFQNLTWSIQRTELTLGGAIISTRACSANRGMVRFWGENQIRFLGYMGGRSYELPFLPTENRVAQVTVYQTSDFAGFGEGEAFGFPNQLQALSELLQNGVDPARWAEPLYENEQSIPLSVSRMANRWNTGPYLTNSP